MTGLSSGFLALLLTLFLAGLGQSVQHPLCSSILSTAFSADRRRGALGTYNFAGDLGKFTIAGSTSLVLAAGVAWQAPAIGFGAMLVLGAGLLMFALIRTNAGGLPAVPESADIRKAKGWGITDRGGFVSLCAIGAIDSATRAGVLTFVAFLMLAKDVSEGWALQAIPAVLVGGMVGKLACGYLADRIGVIRTVVITEVATAVGIILVVVLPNVAAFRPSAPAWYRVERDVVGAVRHHRRPGRERPAVAGLRPLLYADYHLQRRRTTGLRHVGPVDRDRDRLDDRRLSGTAHSPFCFGLASGCRPARDRSMVMTRVRYREGVRLVTRRLKINCT